MRRTYLQQLREESAKQMAATTRASEVRAPTYSSYILLITKLITHQLGTPMRGNETLDN